MAKLSVPSSSSLVPSRPLEASSLVRPQSLCRSFYKHGNLYEPKPIPSFRVKAAKLPPGVQVPKVEPKLTAPSLGFTRTAEIWNSRACMIGLIGTFIVELIFHKGILQMIGVDVGKGLDLPL